MNGSNLYMHISMTELSGQFNPKPKIIIEIGNKSIISQFHIRVGSQFHLTYAIFFTIRHSSLNTYIHHKYCITLKNEWVAKIHTYNKICLEASISYNFPITIYEIISCKLWELEKFVELSIT